MRRVSALFIPLLIFSSVAGCLSASDTDCWTVPWPDRGTSVAYDVQDHASNTSKEVSMEVGGDVSLVRGDGQTVMATVLNVGTVRTYIEHTTGNIVAFELLGFRLLALNAVHEAAYANLLWGRCITSGDSFSIPAMDATQALYVTKVDASEQRLTVEILEPSWTYILGDQSDEELVRLSFRPGEPFPRIVESFHGSDPVSPLETFELQDAGTMSARADRLAPMIPFDVPGLDSRRGCQELPVRHPDLSDLDAAIAFDTYLSNVTADTSLDRYLSNRPTACPVTVTYEVVTEPNSTSYVWTSLYADPTGEGYLKRFATRCFSDPALVLIYGECRTSSYYARPDEVGPLPVTPVDPSTAGFSVDVALAQERIGAHVSLSPTRIVWRAFEPGEVSHPLEPSIGMTPVSALDFDYGTLYRDVRYVTYEGTRVLGGNHSTSYARVWPNGWVDGLSAELTEA